MSNYQFCCDLTVRIGTVLINDSKSLRCCLSTVWCLFARTPVVVGMVPMEGKLSVKRFLSRMFSKSHTFSFSLMISLRTA